MPQMSPINWLSLLFIFCLTFIMFNLLNFFSFNIYKKSIKLNNDSVNNKSTKIYNWKW
uniref:ATP synthase complex subunit 8 n=1 Tax=Bradysia sp. XQM-2020 TaxID=2715249 RepID=A0A6G7GAX2_9DIPT|nr:ATP synthase F0 subunit 8 [Bradysia sp. XQM-2020]